MDESKATQLRVTTSFPRSNLGSKRPW